MWKSPTGSNDGDNSDSATTTVMPGSADLAVAKTAPETATVFEEFTHTIVVTNNGPDARDGRDRDRRRAETVTVEAADGEGLYDPRGA